MAEDMAKTCKILLDERKRKLSELVNAIAISKNAWVIPSRNFYFDFWTFIKYMFVYQKTIRYWLKAGRTKKCIHHYTLEPNRQNAEWFLLLEVVQSARKRNRRPAVFYTLYFGFQKKTIFIDYLEQGKHSINNICGVIGSVGQVYNIYFTNTKC